MCKGELVKVIERYRVESLGPFRHGLFRFGNIHDGLKVTRL